MCRQYAKPFLPITLDDIRSRSKRNMNILINSRKLKGKCLSINALLTFCRGIACSDRFVSVIEDNETRTANIILQKAPVNSLSLELLQQITTSIQELERKKFRGCVISSSMPNVFSAGLDIMEMYRPKEERFRAFRRSLLEMFKTLYLTPLVTIAAINGHAPAGACLLTQICDYRIMLNGKGAIGMNEVRLGLTLPKWFQDVLIRNMGGRAAEKAVLTGTLFSPEQALSLGLVDELASDLDDLKSKARNQMFLFTKSSALAYQTTKIDLRKPVVDDLSDYQEREIDEAFKSLQTEAVQNTLGRYLNMLKSKKS